MESNIGVTRADFDAQEQSSTQATSASQEQRTSASQPEAKNDKGNLAKQAAAGLGGAAAGVAGAVVAMGFVDPDTALETPTTDTPAEYLPSAADFDGAAIPQANGVTDDMSFSEAFAAARAETGPGGVFEWQGGVYGTYYRNEWSQLSPEYREAFSNYPYQSPDDFQPDDNLAHAEPIVAPSGDDMPDVVVDDIPDVLVDDVPDVVVDDVPDVIVDDVPDVTPPDVEVLGVHYVDLDGQMMAVAPVNLDGNDVVLVDFDNDGVFDAALADNGTEIPDMYDLSEHHISYDDASLIQPEMSQEPIIADNNMPDYMNNASVDSYITD